ncbi:LysR family transcriptional regulator [uncultured Xylophilus sp.]|uniref:LysR family transcriptional regulator n=1 Tax=uncultured Xylophilus sp. TaxID=296832 RepID=UPI0025E032CD|nr:LysR family transcriptional regulator [uncultured Xylophilus sp.]
MRHLRCLIAVAEERHFGRAAARLRLSQPPVSLAIKELETELGLRLFERSSRQIVLTPGGEQVLRDARAVLARTESLRHHAQGAALGHAGTLAIGFISLAACSFLPEALRRFTQEFPGVRVTLHESTTDQIVHDLETGTLDVGCIFASPQLPPALAYRTTALDPLVAALPAGHALAALDEVLLGRLAGEQFLCFERHFGPTMFDAVVSACMRHGFSPRIFPARQMPTIVSLVAGGLGVALVPACVQVLQREGVAYRPLRGPRTVVETGTAWRADDDAPTVREFVKLLPQPG